MGSGVSKGGATSPSPNKAKAGTRARRTSLINSSLASSSNTATYSLVQRSSKQKKCVIHTTDDVRAAGTPCHSAVPHPSNDAGAERKEERDNTDAMSNEGWVLPAPPLSSNQLSLYPPLHSTIEVHHRPSQPQQRQRRSSSRTKAAVAAPQAERHNGGYFADLLSPDSPEARGAKQSDQADVNTHSTSRRSTRGDDALCNCAAASQAVAEKDTSAQRTAENSEAGDYAILLTSPPYPTKNDAEDATEREKYRRLSTLSEPPSPMVGDGGKERVVVRPPVALAVWRAPPQPPAATPAPPPTASSPSAAQNLVTEVVATPPFSVATAAAPTTVTSPSTSPKAEKKSQSDKKTRGEKPQKSKAVPAKEPLPVSEESLVNFRSLLGPSPTPLHHALPTTLLSVPPSVRPSFCVAETTPQPVTPASTSGRVRDADGEKQSQSHPVHFDTPATPATAANNNSPHRQSEEASVARSTANHTPEPFNTSSTNSRNPHNDYGSFLFDYVTAALPRRVSTPAATTGAEERPSKSLVAGTRDDQSHIPRSPQKKKDTGYTSAQDPKPIFSPANNNSVGATADVMATSLFLPSPRASPVKESLSSPSSSDDGDGSGSSLLGSPTELSLPYARNLRPRQWQYASMLQRKIGDKVQERLNGAESMKRNTKKSQLSPEQKVSASVTPAKPQPPSAASQHARGQRAQFPEMPAGQGNTSEGVPGNVESPEGCLRYASFYGYDFSSFSSPAAICATTMVSPAKLQQQATPTPTMREATEGTTEEEEAAVASKAVPARAPNSPLSPVKKTRHPATRRAGEGYRKNNEKTTQRTDTPPPFNTAAAGGKEGEAGDAVPRVSSLLSIGDSVFTDNGYPILAPHLSDFFRESLASLSESSEASLGNKMEDSSDRVEMASNVVVVNGRRLLQGVGFPSRSTSSSISGPPNPSPQQQRRASVPVSVSPFMRPQARRGSDALGSDTMASMSAVDERRPPLPPRRWSTTGQSIAAVVMPPPSSASRQQLLRDQQRRLLREQRLYVRQLRTADVEPAGATAAPESIVLVSGKAIASPAAAPATCTPPRAEQVSDSTPAQPQQHPPPLPMPQTREMIARAFFAAETPVLNLKHRGTTAKASPQPDIQYGPFVATDKSRFIDFEKALGFSLKDVQRITSPTWASLPIPEPDLDSEEL